MSLLNFGLNFRLNRLRWPGTQCQVCAQWQRDVVCPDCQRAFRHGGLRCRCCATRLVEATGLLDGVCAACVRHPPAFDRTCATLDYAYPWDGLVTRFKFGGACELAGPLGAWMVEALQAVEPMPEVVVPVPLAVERLRERGYNQAWELARRVGPALGVVAQARWVERVIATPHQVGLGREARMLNLRGAFAVTSAGRAGLAGRSVAIVDDVMTTGSTARELAATLRRAGAAAVQVWVLARTMSDDADPCSASSSSTPKSRPTPAT